MGEEQIWIRDIQRHGSRQAADQLVRAYYDEIYRFAYRQLDWKKSCRLSLRAVTAVRTAVFGGASVLVCVPVNLWLWGALGGELPLSWMMGVSLSSLFLYGILSLVCLEKKGRLAVLPVSWGALGVLLMFWNGASAWLAALPGVVFLVLAGGTLALYLLKLKRFCLGQRKGAEYAVG